MDLGIGGKAALVVAGSRGLGRATAEALTEEGVRVMLSSRDQNALDEVRASMRARGSDVETRTADITDPSAPAMLVDATVQAFGAIDIVIANAGGPPVAGALELDDAMLDDALNANLKSAVRLARAAIPAMRRQGWGRVCCITSYSVVQPIPTLALSNTARAGLWAWAKTAAHDLGVEQSGVTVNLICPGPHATDRMRELGGTGVMGDPADFGRVATFLCSRQAAFINGAAVVVDGGATLAL
ncbi:MAG TPA: SDR family oxidoreductase [Acidimicrobiales bacterium]|jgi:3-oxoacyl-[acyl-carrier protein] reductase|nr:SDR family oxidoreductase [Acidimicrobiales bacterium]